MFGSPDFLACLPKANSLKIEYAKPEPEFPPATSISKSPGDVQTKRPPGNWAAFSSRENSSNGGLKTRQNFLAKSYEPKNGGVKRFLRNKRLYFQQFTESVNTR
jgi:hypothetical protein